MTSPDPTPVNETTDVDADRAENERLLGQRESLLNELTQARRDLEEAKAARGALWELLKDSVRMVKRCEQSMDLLNTERLQLRRDNAALRENLACERPRCTHVDERGRRCLEARTDRHVHVYDEASWIVLHNADRPDDKDDSEDESDLALLRTLVGPRNDLPFSVWAEQTMRRILDRMKRLREAIAAQPARPEPGQGNRDTEGEPERVEWNPAGYDWHPATVVERRSDTHLVIRLDDNRQELLVETRHCRPATSERTGDER